MEAPIPESIPVFYPRHGYLSVDAAPDFSNPDTVDQTNGKVIDLILSSQPFEITNVEYGEGSAKVTVTYQGDENDKFTALYIPPFDISERRRDYLGKSLFAEFKTTSQKCMLFRSSTATSDKVDMVTRDIFVNLADSKKLPFTTFDKRTENEWQFIVQCMTRSDQLMLIPRVLWRNICSWIS